MYTFWETFKCSLFLCITEQLWNQHELQFFLLFGGIAMEQDFFCPTVVMDLLQMYNKWYPVGNGLAAAGSTWQSILHELWGESITLPRVESLWATGGQGLNKTIPCCRMRGYWEHAVEWTCSPRAIFALPSASYEDSTNSISYPKIRLMCLL